MKNKVLFVCTGNSCRSQIAEGLLRNMAGDRFDIYSAGSHPSRVHPNAIAVMDEWDIDISGHKSESIDDYLDVGIDVVITVCDHANEICPVFPVEVKKIHWSIEDPFRDWNSDSLQLDNFRETRRDLKERLQKFIERN
tara:strand:+ start:329 stop:742 length:414 start_codon:yes stop_codon:yes gene_type:complete